MGKHRHFEAFGVRALIALAVVAVLLRVMVPQGFMAAEGPKGGFPLVICTGHGALTLPGPNDTPVDHGQKGAPACVFAGHGLGAAPPPTIGLQHADLAIYTAPAERQTLDLAPGRGLAAPPPPAHGPPLFL